MRRCRGAGPARQLGRLRAAGARDRDRRAVQIMWVGGMLTKCSHRERARPSEHLGARCMYRPGHAHGGHEPRGTHRLQPSVQARGGACNVRRGHHATYHGMNTSIFSGAVLDHAPSLWIPFGSAQQHCLASLASLTCLSPTLATMVLLSRKFCSSTCQPWSQRPLCPLPHAPLVLLNALLHITYNYRRGGIQCYVSLVR
jgi:hypothetical protein